MVFSLFLRSFNLSTIFKLKNITRRVEMGHNDGNHKGTDQKGGKGDDTFYVFRKTPINEKKKIIKDYLYDT